MKRTSFTLIVASSLILATHSYALSDQTSHPVPALVPALSANESAEKEKAKDNIITNKSICEVKMVMRELWEDNVSWIRNYIVSEISLTADKRVIYRKLSLNQDKIGDAIKPYYGDTAGNELTNLLRQHFSISEKIIKAIKENNKTELRTEQDKWSKNSDDIATFLSSINPNLNKLDVYNILQKNLDLTVTEAKARVYSDWNEDMKAYDENQKLMLMFSDQLVGAIAKQFPEKFTK